MFSFIREILADRREKKRIQLREDIRQLQNLKSSLIDKLNELPHNSFRERWSLEKQILRVSADLLKTNKRFNRISKFNSPAKSPTLPDWVSPPGETIADLIEEQGWSTTTAAKRLGISNHELLELVSGKLEINEEIAKKLAEILGTSSEFWLRREENYRRRLSELNRTGK